MTDLPRLAAKGLALLLMAAGAYALFIALRLVIGSATVDSVILGIVSFGLIGSVLLGAGIAAAKWAWSA